MDERSQLAADLRRALAEGEGAGAGAGMAEELALALRVHAHAAGDPDVLTALDADVDAPVPLHGWLNELPYELAEEGLVDEAIDLCGRLSSLVDAVRMRGARARILAAAGRCERARTEADELLAAFPASAPALVFAGLVFEACDAPDRAEALYRHALELAGDEAPLALAVIEQLAPLLARSGRGDEARTLEEIGARYRAALDEAEQRLARPGAELFGDDELAAGGADDLRNPLDALLRRIFTFAADGEFQDEHAAALGEWFGGDTPAATLDDAMRLAEDESEFAVFLEWLMLDRAGPAGTTIAARFAERRQAGLTPAEQQLLPALLASHLSLYEVASVRAGSGLTLRDLLEDLTLIVAAADESEWIVPGDVFACRLVPSGGTLQTTGSVIPLQSADVPALRARFERLRAGESWRVALKRHARVFIQS